jgi:acyl carrier protein
MDAEKIMGLMQKFFSEKKPGESMENLSAQPVTSLLTDSLDVVDFLMFLEDELQLKTEIDLTQFGPSLMNRNFGELAGEIAKWLSETDVRR